MFVRHFIQSMNQISIMYSQCKRLSDEPGGNCVVLRFRVCTFKSFYNLIKAGHISLPKDGAKVTAEMFS